MAALVQAFPTQQSAAAVSLLQTRPQSASGPLQSNSQIQPHVIMQQRSMTSYGPPTGSNNSAFRNYSGTAPVAPYAFTSTPGLTNSHTKQAQQVWTDNNNKNSAVRPMAPEEARLRYPVSDTSSSSSVSSESPARYHQSHQQQLQQFTRTNPNASARPLSVAASLPGSTTTSATPNTPRPSPDRYRRGKKGDGNVSSNPTVPSPLGPAAPNSSGMATHGMQHTPVGIHDRANSTAATSATTTVMLPIGTYAGQQLRSQSVDDIHTHRNPNGPTKQQIQHRRASVGAFSPGSLTMLTGQVPDLNFSPQLANHRAYASQGSAPGVVARRGSNDSSASMNSTSSHSSRPNAVRFSFAYYSAIYMSPSRIANVLKIDT